MTQCIFESSVGNSEGRAEMYKEHEFKKDSVFSLFPSKGNGAAIFGSLYFISGGVGVRVREGSGGWATGGGGEFLLGGGEGTRAGG